ncbi:MAG TPA: TVP38/TMEM64 family protein [Candidatus Methanoperedens sp.]|nr:TVP38/TMEM64 family protein [Candidatus Methanoperedens sp.]
MSWQRGAATARLKLAALVAGAAALIAAGRAFPIQQLLRSALDAIAGLGPAGVAAFVALYVLACVLMLPGSLLTLGAGAVFGVVRGVAIVSVASTLGATAAFFVGRHLAREWVTRRIAGNPRFAAIDAAVGREGWKIVGLTRLSPAFPFNLLNYAYGLTSVRPRDYVLASWIGMLPGTVMYVYLGSLAGSLATLGAPGTGRSPAQWALFGVGLAATVAVTVVATRIAQRALDRRV